MRLPWSNSSNSHASLKLAALSCRPDKDHGLDQLSLSFSSHSGAINNNISSNNMIISFSFYLFFISFSSGEEKWGSEELELKSWGNAPHSYYLRHLYQREISPFSLVENSIKRKVITNLTRPITHNNANCKSSH